MNMEKCGVVNGQTDKEIEKWMIDEYMNRWMDKQKNGQIDI